MRLRLHAVAAKLLPIGTLAAYTEPGALRGAPGICKKVIPLMKEISGRAPIFEATDDYLKTTLFKPVD